jgi:hypothetical protein
LIIAAIGWVLHVPLLFTSLGPIAYELIEKPESKSARPYNVIVGHFIGIGCGFLALAIVGAWAAAKVASAGFVPAPRMWAAVIAVALTAFFTLLAGAGQPASLATTLLIALGSMQRARDAVAIAAGVLILTAIGAPLRQLRLKAVQDNR